MIKKLSAYLYYKLLLNSSVRYSSSFAPLNSIFNYAPQEKMLYAAMAFAAMGELEGDYLEFGVYKGGTFVPAYHFAKKFRPRMKCYAFDSFQGLPEIQKNDSEEYAHYRKGQYSYSAEEFQNRIALRGVRENQVTLVKGWYDAVLNQATKEKLPIAKAAVIWIDCDLYESTVPILRFITDYIQHGTLIIFDDWYCFRGDPNKGEIRAFREWLNAHPQFSATEFRKYDPAGNSFIIHIRK